MPIKPENKRRYPTDWPQIRARILERAGHCCEWPGCGIRNYSVGAWRPEGLGGEMVWGPLGGNAEMELIGRGMTGYPELRALTFAEAKEAAADNDDPDDVKLIVIVLTVAHLNHTPEDCDEANLRAWCQRHHLIYDAKHHASTAYATRRARANTLELF